MEILGSHRLHLYLFNLLPILNPDVPGVIKSEGTVVALPDFFLNHSMAALAFLAWPALLVASSLASQWRARVLLLVCLSPAAIAIFASAHETSKMVLAGSTAVWLAHQAAPRAVGPLMAAAWVVACLAVIPIVSVAYDQGLQRAEWLPPSARHRIVIWGFTGSKVAEAPILGRGIGSARELGRKDQEELQPLEPGTPFRQSTGWHAHNVYLQTWFEAGVLGVALLCAIGLVVLRAISRLPVGIRAWLYAAFAANALLASSSFSLWAAWFLASQALSAILALLAWRMAIAGHFGAARPAG